jgi:hypothetical protein
MDVNGQPVSPVASTHVLRFRSPRDAARSLARDRRVLARADGLLFHRLVFVGSPRTEGFTIGLVDPRRQLAMCLWRDAEALEAFMERSSISHAWREQTDEYCELRMKPFRAHGTYRGHEPLAGLPTQRAGDGPVAMWTFANIPPRGMWFFWTHIRHATRKLLVTPSLIAGTAGPEHMYRGAMTFTLWDHADAAVAFAYREQPHKGIVNEVRAAARLVDSMFIRFHPDAAAGRWPAYSRFADRFDKLARSLRPSARARDQRAPTP